MGHQLNFYATEIDIQEMEKVFSPFASMLTLHSRSTSSSPQLVKDLSQGGKDAPWLFYYLVRAEDFDKVMMRHVPAQGYWTVDVEASPVIEFIRPFYNQHIMRQGRLYYTEKYSDKSGAIVCKTGNFISWARKIFKVTKKNLLIANDVYYGRDAIKWAEQPGHTIER